MHSGREESWKKWRQSIIINSNMIWTLIKMLETRSQRLCIKRAKGIIQKLLMMCSITLSFFF